VTDKKRSVGRLEEIYAAKVQSTGGVETIRVVTIGRGVYALKDASRGEV